MLFYPHHKTRHRRSAERNGHAGACLNGKIADVIEYFIDLAVRDIYYDFTDHIPKCTGKI